MVGMGIFGIILHGRFLRDIPLMSVYGRPPLSLIQYVSKTARVQAIKDSLLERDHILKILKDHFLKAHKRMKHFADKRRTKRHFEVGDNVLLKLQPYRQSSIKGSVPHKLAAKYYGPDKILEKIEKVVYKLLLSSIAKIHHTFYISQLKKYHE